MHGQRDSESRASKPKRQKGRCQIPGSRIGAADPRIPPPRARKKQPPPVNPFAARRFEVQRQDVGGTGREEEEVRKVIFTTPPDLDGSFLMMMMMMMMIKLIYKRCKSQNLKNHKDPAAQAVERSLSPEIGVSWRHKDRTTGIAETNAVSQVAQSGVKAPSYSQRQLTKTERSKADRGRNSEDGGSPVAVQPLGSEVAFEVHPQCNDENRTKVDEAATAVRPKSTLPELRPSSNKKKVGGRGQIRRASPMMQ